MAYQRVSAYGWWESGRGVGGGGRERFGRIRGRGEMRVCVVNVTVILIVMFPPMPHMNQPLGELRLGTHGLDLLTEWRSATNSAGRSDVGATGHSSGTTRSRVMNNRQHKKTSFVFFLFFVSGFLRKNSNLLRFFGI